MLVNVDYSYSIRDGDIFDVEDPKDLMLIEGYIRDDLEAIFDKVDVFSIVIDKVEEVKLNG